MDSRPQPLWVQDWTDDRAYPMRFEDWCLSQWAWAFFRRNVEYQSDYAHFSAIPGSLPGLGKTPKWVGRSNGDEYSMEFRYCDPPALSGETYAEYKRRNADCEWEDMPLEAYLMKKWHIYHLPDPARDDGWDILHLEEESRPPPYLLEIPTQWERDLGVRSPNPDEIEQVTMRFDVRYSIDRQIEAAKEILLDHRQSQNNRLDGLDRFQRKQSATPAKRKLPVYLRAYDAAIAGVGERELSRKICPGKSSSSSSLRSADEDARRAIAAGTDLVNGGYLALLKFG